MSWRSRRGTAPEWRIGVPSGVARSFTGGSGPGSRHDLGNLMRSHMKGLQANIVHRNRVVGQMCYDLARQYTWDRGKVASRRYYDGWQYNRTPTGSRVHNPVPHSTAVETGREAGKPPPVHKIRMWIVDKGHAGLGNFGGLYAALAAPTGRAKANKRLDAAAYVIGQAIGEKGIKAEPIMQDAFTAARAQFVRLLVHTLLFYNAGGSKGGDFALHWRFTDRAGRVQKVFPTGFAGGVHKQFTNAMQQFQDIAGPIREMVDAGVAPLNAATQDLPGRDY